MYKNGPLSHPVQQGAVFFSLQISGNLLSENQVRFQSRQVKRLQTSGRLS